LWDCAPEVDTSNRAYNIFSLSLSVLLYETTTYIRPFCTLRSIQLEKDLVHLLTLTCLFPEAKVKFRNRNERKREELFLGITFEDFVLYNIQLLCLQNH
jgi:hypothetical protein